MRKVILDTNIGIDILNGIEETIKSTHKFDIFYLPIIVIGELLYGAKNSKKVSLNKRNTNRLIKRCKQLEVTIKVAEAYSEIRFELKQKGKPIPENDIWIAAICKANKLPLMTKDKHFENISGLKLVKT